MRWIAKTFVVAILALLPLTLAIPPAPVVSVPDGTRCLAWVIHNEARGESLKGARAVFDSVVSRARKRNKHVCEVIAQPKQYQGYLASKVAKVDEAMLARYNDVLSHPPVAVGCDYFHATYVNPSWAWNMQRCKKVGRHIFYKEKKHDKI